MINRFTYDLLAILSILILLFVIVVNPINLLIFNLYSEKDIFEILYNSTSNIYFILLRIFVGTIPLAFIILVFKKWIELTKRNLAIWVFIFIFLHIFFALYIYFKKIRSVI
jgi:DMSO/TMAO reductase YedYZ heme-binding membrane subunit